MRLPRKLKKGCRTLKGRPRTKWQRKGQIQKKRLLENIANTACATAVGMELLRQAAKMINPVTFPSGGIVAPPPPKVGVAQMPTGEMVINREQVARLKHAIDIKPRESVMAPILAANISDVLQRMRERAAKNAKFDILGFIRKRMVQVTEK